MLDFYTTVKGILESPFVQLAVDILAVVGIIMSFYFYSKGKKEKNLVTLLQANV